MDSPLQKKLLAVLKRMFGIRDTTPSWRVMCGRVWIGTPTVQLVLRGKNAAVQFFDQIQQQHTENDLTC
jgi:predicted nucleotidyltransferase